MDEAHTAVWSMLNDGYGAEDIAIRLNVDVNAVRDCIKHFRAQGKLPGMYGRAKKSWRNCHE